MHFVFYKFEKDYFLRIMDLTDLLRVRLEKMEIFKNREISFNAEHLRRIIPLKQYKFKEIYKYLDAKLLEKSNTGQAKAFIKVDDFLKYKGETTQKSRAIYTSTGVINVVLIFLKEAQDEIKQKKDKLIADCDKCVNRIPKNPFIDDIDDKILHKPLSVEKNSDEKQEFLSEIKYLKTEISQIKKALKYLGIECKNGTYLIKEQPKKKFLGLF